MAANTIVLNWQDNSNNEDGFKIYKSTNGTDFNYLDSVLAGVQTYTATGITEGQQYWFRVTAYNTGGESAYTQAGPLYCSWTQITIFNFGYWPKSYWPSYWYLKYWQLWGILGTKFINRMRRISRNRKTL